MAELFLASVEATKARGEFVSASQAKITLGEWADVWLANLVQLKPSTRLGYETIVRAAILPRWANVSLANLTHAGIQNWLTEVSATAAPSTTRSYHRVMSMMLKYAVRDGRLSRNPADGVKPPRIIKGKHPYLTHAQVQHLAHLAGDDGDVVIFLAYTGLRWGEMAALRVKDLDTLRRRANVDRAVTEVGRELVYGTPKNHSRRSVPFPSFLTNMLAAHCKGKATDEFVFTAPLDGALRNRNWRRRSFEPAMAKLLGAYPELERLTPHDLRHTAASLAISAGANVKAVQKIARPRIRSDDSRRLRRPLRRRPRCRWRCPQPGRRSGNRGQNVGRPWARCLGGYADHQNSPAIARREVGGPGGARTHDPRIKSPMLCQLSYRPVPLQRTGKPRRLISARDATNCRTRGSSCGFWLLAGPGVP